MLYGLAFIFLAFFAVVGGSWMYRTYGGRAGFLYTATVMNVCAGSLFIFFLNGGQTHGHYVQSGPAGQLSGSYSGPVATHIHGGAITIGHILNHFGITLIVGFILLAISVFSLFKLLYEIERVVKQRKQSCN